MQTYYCKCGRVIKKSTTAETTGNRDTAGCEGCPYLLPYGSNEWSEEEKSFVQKVVGYECRMSQSIDYTTTYMGQTDDKCTLRIVSLDFDFLDEVQAWIDVHSDGNLSGGFSRKNIRGTDFSNNGRYSLSIACAQNRKGMAAKAALIERFFNQDRQRLDKMPDEEKSSILATIKTGKAKANKKEKKMDYIISECEQNDLLYAYYKKEFWFWDENQSKWIVSDFAKNQFEKALKASPELTPQDFMTNADVFWELDEWEISTEQINALELVEVESKAARSDEGISAGVLIEEGTDARGHIHSRARIECGSISAIHVCGAQPDDVKIWLNAMAPQEYWVLNSGDDPCGEHIEVCPYCGAKLKEGAGDVLMLPLKSAAQSQQSCENAAKTQQTEESAEKRISVAEPAPLENGQNTFDYSGLDEQTVDVMHMAETEIQQARQGYIIRVSAAVAIVHDELVQNLDEHNNQHSESTFVSWCSYVGISRSTAYNLLQVNALMSGATPEEMAQLEHASPSLLYAAAKPSAPAELVQAVKSGDITTHKDFKALEKQLAEERELRRQAEHGRDCAVKDLHQLERESAEDQQRLEGLLKNADERLAAEKHKSEGLHNLLANRNEQLQKAQSENSMLLDRQGEHIARIKELENRPIDVAVQQPDPEDINRLAAEKAKNMTAMLSAQVEWLKNSLEAAEKDADQSKIIIYNAASQFAQSAAETIDTIGAQFMSLCASLAEDDAVEAAAPMIDAAHRLDDLFLE